MSRVTRFAIAGVLWLVAAFVRVLAVQFFGPTSPFREMNAGAQVGSATAEGVNSQIYQIAGTWVPLALIAFGFAYLVLMEYRQQRVGSVYRAP